MFQESAKGVTLSIKVLPKSSFTGYVGFENGVLKVKLKAVPEKGKANEELIAFLSSSLRIPKSKILLLRGETSKQKTVCFLGMKKEEVEKLFEKII
ncbi:MAG: DUF167 domain-containing protein [Chlamydiae bacterium]|nr:DUF167 domain-containing protein [Chlamydiota bacterium]